MATRTHWGGALLLALLLAACGPEPARPANEAVSPPGAASTATLPAPEPERQVRTVTASRGTLRSSRSAAVRIEPAQEAQVAAGASGQVARVLAREGARVAAGEAVVQLATGTLELQLGNARLALESARVNLASAQNSSREGLAQAQAALRSAQLGRDNAQQQHAQGQQLHAAGGLSSAELRGLEAQLAQAEAALQQAQDAVARAGRSGGEDLELLRLQVSQAENGLAQAQRSLTDARVSAPFAGEVAQLLVEEGEFVGAGSPVFRLVSAERQLARFSVPPEDAVRLLQKDVVHIPYGGLDYAAQILRSSEVPGQSRLVELTALLYQAEARIPTGAVAQLAYEVELGSGLLLPTGALQSVGGESFVFVVEDGWARRRTVRLIGEAGAQVLLEGLEPGVEVVYPLPGDLRDGQAVSVLGAGLP